MKGDDVNASHCKHEWASAGPGKHEWAMCLNCGDEIVWTGLLLEIREAHAVEREWGIYVLTGPSANTWCQHTEGLRIEVDERTARTIALLFTERFEHRFKYEAKRLESAVTG